MKRRMALDRADAPLPFAIPAGRASPVIHADETIAEPLPRSAGARLACLPLRSRGTSELEPKRRMDVDSSRIEVDGGRAVVVDQPSRRHLAGISLTVTPRKIKQTWSPLLASLVVLSVAGCSSNDHSTGTGATPRVQLVLDYSPTLSDASALLYLASHPAIELLAVTLPGTGEADCEPGTRTTRALLAIAGDDTVPVGCGRNDPLIGDRDWPEEWRTEVNRWGTDMLPAVDSEQARDAEQLLIDTLTAATTPITVVAVGPLTNLGVVLAAHPELAERIERIVIMGGAINVPGNVEASPAAEWNIYIDPEAARRVLASGVPVTLIPLDATNHLPWTERLLRRLATLDGPAARTVHQLAESRATLDGFYLWDELAAMAAVAADLVTLESMTVRIDDDGAIVQDPDGGAVLVAISADTDAASEEFLRTLNNGTLPEVVPLTATELDYMAEMGGIDSRLNAALSRAYEAIEQADDSDPRDVATTFLTSFADAVASMMSDMRGLHPPGSLSEAHDDYVEVLTRFVDRKDDLLTAIADAVGTDLDQLIADAMTRASLGDIFDRVSDACQALKDYSFLHDGPSPCSSAAPQ